MVSYWTEPLHVIKCPQFSAMSTQYCNNNQGGCPCLVLSSFPLLLRLASRFFFMGVGCSFACNNLQREHTHLNILHKASEHCELQRKVHARLCGGETTVCRNSVEAENIQRVHSRFMCAFCRISLLHLAPALGLWVLFNIKGLTKSAAPHKKKKPKNF